MTPQKRAKIKVITNYYGLGNLKISTRVNLGVFVAPKIGNKAYMRKYRAEHPQQRQRRNEQVKAYQATPKGYAALRAGHLNSRAKALGLTGRVTGQDLLRVLSTAICAHPDCEASSNLQIDHILPLSDGGDNVASNLCLLCQSHHSAKTKAEQASRARGEGVPEWVSRLTGKEPAQQNLF